MHAIRLALVALVLVTGNFVLHADEVPPAFLGSWMRQTGGGTGGNTVTGISVTAKSYHEPGYNCDIGRMKKSEDTADATAYVYIVEMKCTGDGERPGPAQRVREVWALRNVNGKDVLVTSGTSSISILQPDR